MWATIAGIALVIGGAESYFRLKPLLLGIDPPVSVDPNDLYVSRHINATGGRETIYHFNALIRMTCGAQMFERRLVDERHNESKAPIVTSSPGSTSQFFGQWLPIGLQRGLVTVVSEEPGRQGNIYLLLLADHCPNGFKGQHLVYAVPFDWKNPPTPKDATPVPVRKLFQAEMSGQKTPAAD